MPGRTTFPLLAVAKKFAEPLLPRATFELAFELIEFAVRLATPLLRVMLLRVRVPLETTVSELLEPPVTLPIVRLAGVVTLTLPAVVTALNKPPTTLLL